MPVEHLEEQQRNLPACVKPREPWAASDDLSGVGANHSPNLVRWAFCLFSWLAVWLGPQGYAFAAPVQEWPTADPFKVVIGGQSVAVIATPDDPSAHEADFAQWLAQELGSQLEIDVPIKGASQITDADTHVLAIGQAASNSLLADLAQRHVVLASATYPGPGGYLIEAVSDGQRELLVIGFVDDAGADAASQAWLDLIASETDDAPVFVRRIEIPMFNALPGHLVDEETPPISMDVLMAKPRERWFYRRMPDVPYILNSQLQDSGPEIGAPPAPVVSPRSWALRRSRTPRTRERSHRNHGLAVFQRRGYRRGSQYR